MTLQVIGILALCAGLLLEIAMIGSQFHLGAIIATAGVIVYVVGRFTRARGTRSR